MKHVGKMISEVVRHLFKKPATVNYPFEPAVLPAKFRGKICFDSANCIGCKLCMKDCPAFAIKINKVGDKQFEAEFQLDRCIYCAQCVEACNKDALRATQEFELAQIDKKAFRVVYHADPSKRPAPASAPASPGNSRKSSS